MTATGHFNDNSEGYRRFRPVYPQALFRHLASLAPARKHAWDCACGTGQAATALATYFNIVTATDISSSQLAAADARDNIDYRQVAAEDSGLADDSIDLVTVAQALHWFDHDAFYREVRRVTRPQAIIAAWTYGLFRISDDVDNVVFHLYDEIVEPFWPPERRHIENNYADIPFPFENIPCPDFTMQAQWSLDQVTGYLGTWSAVRRYQTQNKTNPVTLIDRELRKAWGDTASVHTVSWPLALRIGRIE